MCQKSTLLEFNSFNPLLPCAPSPSASAVNSQSLPHSRNCCFFVPPTTSTLSAHISKPHQDSRQPRTLLLHPHYRRSLEPTRLGVPFQQVERFQAGPPRLHPSQRDIALVFILLVKVSNGAAASFHLTPLFRAWQAAMRDPAHRGALLGSAADPRLLMLSAL